MTAPPDHTKTDTSAIIAALRSERDAALAREAALAEALTTRNSEFGERIEQQSATIDVLKVMSASPGDPLPVFDLIANRARAFCEGDGAMVTLLEDGTLHLCTHIGATQAASAAYEAYFPCPVDDSTTLGRAVLTRAPVHNPDLLADPRYRMKAITSVNSVRSNAAVPILRGGVPIGAIGIAWLSVGEFPTAQLELLKTFAEQAVIAITSAETYRALQTRTADLQESLEYQTATSDVLNVMSRSTFDLQPVLTMVAETAARLCAADQAVIIRHENGIIEMAANSGFPPEYEARLKKLGPHRLVADAPMVTYRAISERRVVHIHDVAAVSGYAVEPVELGQQRTSLGVPLLREGETIGNIMLARQRVEPFTDRQIELVSTFADQAVIAIENTRLLTEQREALEQQTATAEVLQLINASPGNLAPVFDAMLDRAMHLCNGVQGTLWMFDGERMRASATAGYSSELAEQLSEWREMHPFQQRLSRGDRVFQIVDLAAEELYHSGNPLTRAAVDVAGIRTVVFVALVKDATTLGGLTIGRRDVRAFTDKHIAVLQNLAEQAVVAIENARLINEQREALEQQTATAEVLQVINASPGNLVPVFDAMLDKAIHLCDATYGHFRTYDGEGFPLAAVCGDPSLVELHRQRMLYFVPGPHNPISRFRRGERLIHISDAGASDAYRDDPGWRELVDTGACRSVLAVALRKDTVLLGYISVYRREVRAFSDKQIALLENFAAQAVIAIENARLLGELQERTAALAQRNNEYGERIEQQSATIDVLKAMSASPDDTQPVFDLIARRAQQLCNGASVGMFEFDGNLVYARASSGGNQAAIAAFQGMFPMAPTRESLACRAILDRQIVHVPDMNAEQGLLPAVRNLGAKSTLSLPLLRDGRAIGAMSLNAWEVGGFSDNQIELLKTFAEQAVIAVGSAETFRELRARTAELTRSVAELQALEEVLRAVNSSLDLDTVLATIISRAVQLSQADEGTIYEFDATEEVFVPKAAFGMTAERVEWLRERKVRLGETHLGRSAVLRAPVQIDDVQRDPTIADAAGLLRGIHAVLAVPLLREDNVVGGLVIRRRTAGGFAPTIPTLLQTFAGQAVLAIENAQLFQDARRARAAAEAALVDLRRTQARLVQTEKMASLGQLTAGIAHEIKNPLNFVNNFSDLSVDLLDELHGAVAPDKLAIAADLRAEIDDLTATLKGNLEKIAQHGRRADSIVKNMLLHSRSGPSERRAIDLNSTVEEALNLAYHGARAQDQSFNITLGRDFGEGITPIELSPQDMTRVFLNLFSNGFYAALKRQNSEAESGFEPVLKVTTRDLGDAAEIRVWDNGTGIPADIKDKLFQPFFTTKPTGEGTGLGLSISYDIVTQQHGGTITVESEVGAYTEFTITIPRLATAVSDDHCN